MKIEPPTAYLTQPQNTERRRPDCHRAPASFDSNSNQTPGNTLFGATIHHHLPSRVTVTFGARRPLNHRIFAILWIFVSGPAVFLLLREPAWRKASPGLDRLRALNVEQWIAVILLLIQLYLMVRAWMDHVRERVDRETAASPKSGG